MGSRKPIEVAIIGGGCASIAAAFELTRPGHKGAYHVTIYQIGWRLGGKGASGRGPAGRIEEHGLHVWLGCYDNAFRLLRQCYDELNARTEAKNQGAKAPVKKKSRRRNWDDFFLPDSHIAAGTSAHGGWINWAAHFPPAPGLPGDAMDEQNPFALSHYLARAVSLLRTLLLGLETFRASAASNVNLDADLDADKAASQSDPAEIAARIAGLLRVGALASAAIAVEALALVEAALKAMPKVPEGLLLPVLETIASALRKQFEAIVANDDHTRYQWEIIDLILANLVGAVRYKLLTDPRGLDAIDHLDHREWLRENGASERALNSPFTRVLYDTAMAYEGGDEGRPTIAAGAAVRGTLRFFFTYRGALLWKMRAGMGDVVFAPFYEVLRARGATFKFFHRLRNVRLADASELAPGEKPHVEALEFDIQAETPGAARISAAGRRQGHAMLAGRTGFFPIEGRLADAARGLGFRVALGPPEGKDMRTESDARFRFRGAGHRHRRAAFRLWRDHRHELPLARHGRTCQDGRHAGFPDLACRRPAGARLGNAAGYADELRQAVRYLG